MLEAGRLRPRYQQGWFFLRLGGRIFSRILLDSAGLLAIIGVPWLVDTSSQFPTFMFTGCFPLYMSASKFPLYIRTLFILDQGSPNDLILILLITSAMTLSPNKFTF